MWKDFRVHLQINWNNKTPANARAGQLKRDREENVGYTAWHG